MIIRTSLFIVIYIAFRAKAYFRFTIKKVEDLPLFRVLLSVIGFCCALFTACHLSALLIVTTNIYFVSHLKLISLSILFNISLVSFYMLILTILCIKMSLKVRTIKVTLENFCTHPETSMVV